MSDRLRDTLSTLRTDVDSVPLADSSAVRARGTQRTRRQAVGTSLAVVALVAGAVGISGALTGNDDATNLPADPTTSQSSEPTLDLAADPLVQPADIGTVGPYGAWQVNPDPVAADQQLSLCVPFPGGLGGTQNESRLLYGDMDAGLIEHVIRFPDADAAQLAADRLTQSFANCSPGDPAEVGVDDRQPQDVAPQGSGLVADADLAVHASRTSTPVAASEINYYELGIVRAANVLVVLQWSSGPLDGVDWVWDADRMTAALDRAVG